jgi:hypothetical protein
MERNNKKTILLIMEKQYIFKYKATNNQSKIKSGTFISKHSKYGMAYDELTDHLICLFGTGFELKIINIIVRKYE